MQDGIPPSEYKRIKAEFEKIKAKRAAEGQSSSSSSSPPQQPPQRSVVTPSPATKQAEARFTVTQGLLIVFLSLVT